MKGSKYAKTLARGPEEYFVYEISEERFYPIIEICMETPCWCPPGWPLTWRTENNRNICFATEFCYKSVNLFFEELINIKGIRFITHELFR